MTRRTHQFDKRSLAASVGVHVSIALLFWLSGLVRGEPMEFVTYEIVLVSPPPALQAEVVQPATEELVVERPDPTPAVEDPEPEEDVVPVEEDDPPPQPPEPEPTPVEQLAEEEETTASAPEEPPEEAEESGEDLNVRIEGLRQDYPVYYNNIILQIESCFRPPNGDWATAMVFNLERDGSVNGVEFVARSGSFDFDFSAMGAIECAGNGRFGPLPDDYQWDRLRVRFDFKPRGEPLEVSPRYGAARPR